MSVADVRVKSVQLYEADSDSVESAVYNLYRSPPAFFDVNGEKRRLNLYEPAELEIFIRAIRKKFDELLDSLNTVRKDEAEAIYVKMIALLRRR